MGLYKYLAAAKGEAPHEILIEADSIAEAQSKLRSRKIVPVRYCGEATVSGGRFTLRRSKVTPTNSRGSSRRCSIRTSRSNGRWRSLRTVRPKRNSAIS